MDFGTIRRNLENGAKYMNADDVFSDVQYIWENCHKYNKPGNPILELVDQVKEKFTMFWNAAGLYGRRKQTKGQGKHFRSYDLLWMTCLSYLYCLLFT